MAGNAFSGRRKTGKTAKAQATAVSQGLPTCPDWMDADSAALFTYLAGELSALGLLSTLDSQALAQYCTAISDYIRFTQRIRALNEQEPFSGDLHMQGESYQNVSPLHTLRNQAEKRADTLGKQFGLTPLARRTLQDLIKTKDEGDAIEKKFFSD